jgi:hypothetical protein
VPFCAGMDDAVASALGKNLPRLAAIDTRGCNEAYSLSEMIEGQGWVDLCQEVEKVVAGFMEYELPANKILRCNLVLEHILQPDLFTKKLLSSGETSITSKVIQSPQL